ncbi:YDG domain-containing protein [Actomonas aquatica]|uniref:YDG domain-containing protein n=1 Tax=Actomonas aquatica TaxID=2866162 RepID=A0ABZ1CBH3_9BACT|nr:YDG domain-containing protein [Opitutus sp. WL0086]WRQ88672.1 YDG domain-containing protein [Opitutus sp. WL0086]
MHFSLTGLLSCLRRPALPFIATAALFATILPGRANAQTDPYVFAYQTEFYVEGGYQVLIYGFNLANATSVRIGDFEGTILTDSDTPNSDQYLNCVFYYDNAPAHIEFPYFNQYIYVETETGSGQSFYAIFAIPLPLDSPPEITVSGNEIEIPSGDTTPSLEDHSDFGEQAVSSGSVARTYSIRNVSYFSITLDGTPTVALSGDHSGDFEVVAQPSDTELSRNEIVSFTVLFDPSEVGLRTATISIDYGDVDGTPFSFAIQGTGTGASNSVSSVTTPADGTYKAGDTLSFTVNYSGPVDVTGTPLLDFTLGTAERSASYTAGSGTASLTFTYTIAQGDDTTAGLSVSSSLDLNDGSIASSGETATVSLDLPATDPASVVVDTIAPSAPSAPILNGVSDSGPPPPDGVTSFTSLIFTGTAESGTVVKLYDTDGTTEIGSVTASNGFWSITTSPLSEGDHTVTARAIDAAGNVSAASGSRTVTVDLTPPQLISATTIELNVGAVSLYTFRTPDRRTTYTIDEALPAGLSLTGANGALTGTPTAEGTFNVTVNMTDGAGHSGSETVTINIGPPDTVAPRVVSVALEGDPQPGAQEITYKVVFSEPVLNVNLEDFDIDRLSGFAVGFITQAIENDDHTEVLVRATLNGNLYGEHPGNMVLSFDEDRLNITDRSGNPLADYDESTVPSFTSNLTVETTTGEVSLILDADDIPDSAPFQLNTASLGLLIPQIPQIYPDRNPVRLKFTFSGLNLNEPMHTPPPQMQWANMPFTCDLLVLPNDSAEYKRVVTFTGTFTLGAQPILTPGDTGISYSANLLNFQAITASESKIGNVNTFLLTFKLNLASVGIVNSLNITEWARIRYPVSPIRINEVKYREDGSDLVEFLEFYDGGIGNTTTRYVDFYFDYYLPDGPIDIVTNDEGYFVVGQSSVANVDNTLFDVVSINGSTLRTVFSADNPSGNNILLEYVGELYPLPVSQSYSLQKAAYTNAVESSGVDFYLAPPTPGAPNSIFVSGDQFGLPENSTTASFDVDAFGGDPEDIEAGVTYAITGGADAAAFSINTTTGVVSLTTSLDFEQPSDADTDNVYVLEVTASRAAPLSDTHTQTISVTVTDVDDTAPDAPSDLALTAASDSGTSDTDRITNDTTPTFTGTAEAGSTVRLYDTDGTTELGSATATDGTWSITASALTDGIHTVSATATDAAGNTSDASSGLSLTIDTAGPTISNLSLASLTYGQEVNYEIMAAGAIGFGATSALPTGTSLNPTTGALSGAPTAVGNLTSTFEVSDAAGNTAERSITFTVNPASLSITGLTAANKTYDGTTSTTLSGSASLVGVIGSDEVQLDGTAALADFVSPTVGTAKTVSVAGFTLTGIAAANYSLNQPTGLTADITVQTLTVTGIVAEDKAYDRSVTATLDVDAAELVGVIDSDEVELLTGNAEGTFASYLVGTDIAVSIGGLGLTGPDAGNYALTLPSTVADITPAPAWFQGIVAENKTYDGSEIATLNTSNGLIYGIATEDGFDVSVDESAVTVTFADANIGTDKPVTVSGYALTGAAAANYALEQPSDLTADITPAELSITGVTAANKTYDSTTAVTLNADTPALVGIVDDEDVTLAGTAAGAFADADIGTAKPIIITGYSLAGEDIANYVLSETVVTANITPAEISLSGLIATNRPYDATIHAPIDDTELQLIGVQGSDEIGLDTSAFTASFNDADVGDGKAVILDGLALTGSAAGNYTLTYPSDLAASILPAQISVEGVVARNKVYDGSSVASADFSSISLTGIIGSEDVLLNSASATAIFDAPMVGADRTVTFSGLFLDGRDSPNYVLVSPATTADITPATLTVSGVTATTKTYDATTTASLSFETATLNGIVPGDDVALVTSSATGTFGSATLGSDLTVSVTGLSLIGSDAGNYLLTAPTATASITAAELTLPGLVVGDKTYDATTTASLAGSDFGLTGIQGDDDVQLTDGTATATFADKQVGTGKPITVNATLTGADAANYTLTLPSELTADIAPAELTLPGLAITAKTYDGTTSATLDSSAGSLTGIQGDDDVAADYSGVIATYDTAIVGTAKSVDLSGLDLTGTDASNYTLTAPTLTGDVTAALITVSADKIRRPYGDPNPSLTFTYSGFVTGEDESVVSGEPVLATDATRVSAIGSYDITIEVTPLSATNYVFTGEGSGLTITPGYHFADTDRDYTIGLSELLRVIELYNYREGSRRLGAYRSNDDNTDRYEQGDGDRILPHTADTNADGQLSLLELTRVIELYNTRDGATRTGTYHYVGDSEDGFAPGPDRE